MLYRFVQVTLPILSSTAFATDTGIAVVWVFAIDVGCLSGATVLAIGAAGCISGVGASHSVAANPLQLFRMQAKATIDDELR